ncbi:MAG: hypothetical protein OES84_03205 [Kiritimatiellaceae bacterium]|nr:hypothetical protein [Kiritimatiellaceae bacterium]
MKKRLATVMCIALAAIFASTTVNAKNEKKNAPKKKEVEKLLKEIAGDHYVEKMKIYEVGSIKVKPTYYHVFSGILRKGGYRIIIYDNTPKYLGFYTTDYEPCDYEEGAVLMKQSDGETYYKLTIGSKGPADRANIGGIPTKFTKNPKLEEEAKTAEAEAGTGKLVVPEKEKSKTGEVIDYRDWKITMKGREITVNAIFVKFEKGKVTIKDAKRGKEAIVPGNALSDEDKEYVKRITAKK